MLPPLRRVKVADGAITNAHMARTQLEFCVLIAGIQTKDEYEVTKAENVLSRGFLQQTKVDADLSQEVKLT